MIKITFNQKLLIFIFVHFAISVYTLFTHWSFTLLMFAWITAKIFNAIGNEVALHRLWCHKSFKTTKFKEWILHMFSIPLLYGSSITYTGVHRQHHAYSDTDKDPHITKPWWKVVFYVRNEKYNIETKFVADLIRSPVHRFIHRHYFKINIVLLLTLLAIFGIEFTGYFLSFNVFYNFVAAGLVNTLGHRPDLGTRNYDTSDMSTNNSFLKWLTWNEGYHNNHHHKPSSHTYALNPGEFDFPAWIIEKFFMVNK